MDIKYSFIIPVYNRPQEVDELLASFCSLKGDLNFEVVIVEDGSEVDCRHICSDYDNRLYINYFYKDNSGPGRSRNYGMARASGNYYIILDSDCVLPPQYLAVVHSYLTNNFTDCYGGSDSYLETFTVVQKAIDYSLTSFLTTGGVRGSSSSIDKFQPRSFNMGLSKKAFDSTNGFGNIHPGEDPDLVFRLWQLGFSTAYIDNAVVYHKRRIDVKKFSSQMRQFGTARIILNKRFPEFAKAIFWFPSLFSFGLVLSLFLLIVGYWWPLCVYICYLILLLVHSSYSRGIVVGLQVPFMVIIQFFSYSYGFLLAYIKIGVCNEKEEVAFPSMFFK
ncbi:MAG: glycosyltransferase [Nonlabens sp.]